jgi:hypothetical protein
MSNGSLCLSAGYPTLAGELVTLAPLALSAKSKTLARNSCFFIRLLFSITVLRFGAISDKTAKSHEATI